MVEEGSVVSNRARAPAGSRAFPLSPCRSSTVPSQGFTNAQTKYSYDPLYQLKKAEYPNVAPFNAEVDQWTYDAIGNRLTSQVNASIQTYTYEKITPNPKNAQKLLGDGVNTYAYDFNGSQTSRTGGASYGFVNDLDNRLSSISGAESATYTYDYQGRRTSKTVSGVTTKYLYDGLNLVSETTGGATTRYAFGPSIDEPLAAYASGAVSYLNADGLGSVVATNNTAGTVTHSSIFDAWGVAKSETGTRAHSFTYTGREVAEAGLHFSRARFLDSMRGRFISEDLLRFAGAVHFDIYAGNRPTMYRDPLGLQATMNPNGPDGCRPDCDELKGRILRHARRFVLQKALDIYYNPDKLPMFGPKNTVESHQIAWKGRREGLRRMVEKYEHDNCPDPLPVAVKHAIEMPVPEPLPGHQYFFAEDEDPAIPVFEGPATAWPELATALGRLLRLAPAL